jgi:DNA-binding beta-propeller fold protein YncE
MKRKFRWLLVITALAAITISGSPGSRDVSAKTRYIGTDHLVSRVPLPDMTGQMCLMPDMSDEELALFDVAAELQRGGGGRAAGAAEAAQPVKSYGAPDRIIRDRYPSFSSIAIDHARDQIVVTDENLFQVLFYNRTENNAPNQVARPLRIIGTKWDESLMKHEETKTHIEFQCGLYVDPRNGDVYAVNNDTQDTLVIFSNEQVGNVAPSREIHTPHGTFGITVDEAAQEVFLTVQHDSAMVVYKKGAKGDEPPVRMLQGNRTRLADPHGVALDTKRGVLFVTNHGSTHDVSVDAADMLTEREKQERLKLVNFPLDRDFGVAGSGKTLPPAITVYAKNASGNAAPLRVIEGPRTGLNWPTGIAVDPDRGDVYVTNDTTDSILVFDADANGDVAPKRILKGPRTGLKNPTGLALDFKNNELWVANFGGHTATAYRMNASGDTAPLRTVRAAPNGTPSLMIGNPGAVAFDTKREVILAPN